MDARRAVPKGRADRGGNAIRTQSLSLRQTSKRPPRALPVSRVARAAVALRDAPISPGAGALHALRRVKIPPDHGGPALL